MDVSGRSSLLGQQGGQLMAALIDLLRDTMGFDFIVFDLGQSYHNEVHLTALERSDKNLLVVTPEVPAVLDMRNALIPLKKYLDIDPARFKLVLNKYDEEYGVKRKDILALVNRPDENDTNARPLGLTEFAAIPDGGREVSLSINRHQPILASGQRTPLSDALIGMGNGFYPYLLEIWKRPTRHQHDLDRLPRGVSLALRKRLASAIQDRGRTLFHQRQNGARGRCQPGGRHQADAGQYAQVVRSNYGPNHEVFNFFGRLTNFSASAFLHALNGKRGETFTCPLQGHYRFSTSAIKETDFQKALVCPFDILLNQRQ